MKAKLTGGQVVAAIVAGVFGHLLFAAGWTLLAVVLFGGAITGLLGLTAGGVAGLFADSPQLAEIFDAAGGVVSGVFVGLLIASLVLLLLGFLVSGWILKGGTVRKPWATTWTAIRISVVLSLPLFIAYLVISGRGEGGLPFPLVALLGTVIFGVLVWLWMTWAHRGPASGFAGVSAGASATAVDAPAEAPAVEAVVIEQPVAPADAPAVEAAPAKAPARKPTAETTDPKV